MRKKRLAINLISSFAFQISTIICGFVVPRLILAKYGSEVNGLVSSVTQFLSIISLLELGVGSVVRSSLYKPLAEQNNELISQIIVSASHFFKRFAMILLLYVLILASIYPIISNQNFSWMYTATLIGAISISLFAQYYFGIVNSLLLVADQRGYIQDAIQTLTLIANTIACSILIYMGSSIQLVKFVTSLIYIIRPIVLHYYVKKYYYIDRSAICLTEPIKQKWNGAAQHFASIVLNNTSTVVLTIFSTLSNVSIYSVYNNVTNGINLLVSSTTNGVLPMIGELLAKEEFNTLKETFGWVEWTLHTLTILAFGCTMVLIVPFITIYTYGITDTNYVQPLFAVLITLSYALHCLRLPYNIVIFAAGHYQQTQKCYVVAALLNIIISIIAVKALGLVGATMGAIIAMAYQTVWMAMYNSNNILPWPFKKFIKQIAVDCITIVLIYILTSSLELHALNYSNWCILSLLTVAISMLIVFCVNFIFYTKYIKQIVRCIVTMF